MVGRIVGTHGIKGGLKVTLLSDFPGAFRRRRKLLLGDTLEPHDVVSIRVAGEHAIVRLAGIETVEAAAERRGQLLFVPIADAARPPRGQYFVHEVVGLRVFRTDGSEIGVVRDVLRTGANDVYVIDHAGNEVLIPAIEDVVKEIDVLEGRMVVEPLPGLLDEGD